MKKLIFALFAAAAVLCGCSQEDEPASAGIKITSTSKDVIEMSSEGDKVNLRFTSSGDWHIECTGDWLTITPLEGKAGTGRVVLEAGINATKEDRSAVLTVVSGNMSESITVSQEFYTPTFELVGSEMQLFAAGGSFEVRLRTDVEYDWTCAADWIKEVEAKSPRAYIHEFVADPNPLAESRTAVISFTSSEGTEEFKVLQRAAIPVAEGWEDREFKHRSLAMRFTATWCGYCPYMGTAFETAKQEMGDALEILSLHGADSDLEFSGTSTLARRFAVSGYPTGIVDARASIPNYNSTDYTASVVVAVANETQTSYPASTGISCSSFIQDGMLNAAVRVYFKEAGTYRVTAFMLEDGIVNKQNGAGNSYVHNDVARLALTSVSGDKVVVEEPCHVWDAVYSASVGKGMEADDFRLLIFVEKEYGSRPLVENVQGAEYGSYGDTYIDNCFSAKLGTDTEPEFK